MANSAFSFSSSGVLDRLESNATEVVERVSRKGRQ